jgi:hypothetical protein
MSKKMKAAPIVLTKKSKSKNMNNQANNEVA